MYIKLTEETHPKNEIMVKLESIEMVKPSGTKGASIYLQSGEIVTVKESYEEVSNKLL